MQITIDGAPVASLTKTQVQVIEYYVGVGQSNAIATTLISNAIQNLYLGYFNQLQAAANPILISNNITSVPLDPDTYAQLAFQQPQFTPVQAVVAQPSTAPAVGV